MPDMPHLARVPAKWVDSAWDGGLERLTEVVGGPARRRVILLLASILSLDSADQGAIGAVAPQLESALHISNVQLGLLVTATALVGALATIPMGNLVDHRNRVRLVAGSVILWAVAEAVSAASSGYTMLVVTRVALGAVTAIAAPATASLAGDLFPAGERGRIYGFVVTGELLGAGFGVLVSGEIAALVGWRVALAILALPSFALCYALLRHFPEPARGGHSWIIEGAEAIPATEEDPDADGLEMAREQSAASEDDAESGDLLDKVEEAGITPDEEIVIDEDPTGWSLRDAIRYVVRVRTNVIMIVASSLGYFFFAGLKTFAVLFVRGHYGVSQSLTVILVLVVGIGAVVGVIGGGRFADRAIGRGRITARVGIGIVGYCVAALVLAPALVSTSLLIAMPLIVLGAAGIAAPNATLDAARLDVVPAQLWGRAEAVRTVLRTVLEAFAPLVFGFISEFFGSNRGGFGVVGGGYKSPAGSPAQVQGLQDAFLLMLVPLLASGIMLIWARRTYPVDVASAGESQRRVAIRLESREPAVAAP